MSVNDIYRDYLRAASRTNETVYLRKVYAWLTVGLMLTSGAAWYSLTGFGERLLVQGDKQAMVPNLVADMEAHPFMAIGMFFALGLGAMIFSRTKGLNAVLFFSFSAFSGAFIGPSLFIAQLSASHGHTLSPNPILHAGVLTVSAFVGLTTYVLTTRKDFSAWGGFLMSGLFVLIAAGILGLFVQAEVFHLAVASAGVFIFLGYILYDTSKILLKSDYSDPIGDALNLYLDVLNLFLNLLRIFASSKD